MSALATLRIPRPPAQPAVGACRVCGCTEDNACRVGRRSMAGGSAFVGTCIWVEADLCSRCHGPRRPTRRQAGEIERIRAFCGPCTVRDGHWPGWLTVELNRYVDEARTRVLDMAPSGGVQRRGVVSAERVAA